MNIPEPARQALRNLLGAKMRSLLAILGILVGTASVVTLVTGGHAATQKALESFKSLGTDVLDLRFDHKEGDDPNEDNERKATYEDVMHSADVIPQLDKVAPYTLTYSQISYEDEVLEGSILATNDNLKKILKLQLQEGQFISFVDSTERFCVIGADFAAQLHRSHVGSLLGKQIQLGNSYYTIIGVLAPATESPFFYSNLNQAVIIPIRGVALLEASAGIRSILMTFKPKSDIDELKTALKKYYQEIAPNYQAAIHSPKELIEQMESQTRIFTLLLGLIGGISLLVGGIGVMNVMLVSVTERKKEIGLRKALGATKRDIRQLFLMESVILAMFGGLLGVVFGVVLAMIIEYFAEWSMKLYFSPILIGFLVSAITGVFFGSYPAYTASKLNPIDALRYE